LEAKSPSLPKGRTNIAKIDSVSRRKPNDVLALLLRGPPIIKVGPVFDDEDPEPTSA
jgi:hypothetical protein